MASFGSLAWLHQMMGAYGLWVLFAMVFVGSLGLPLPEETSLVAAALYAGSTHRFSLIAVIGLAFAAAVAGNGIGYLVGRSLGLRPLARFGSYLHLTEPRLKVGQYLFWRYGNMIIFFGRFVPLLRIMIPFLAGANRVTWPRFTLMNALGGLCWATFFAAGAYFLGDRVRTAERPLTIGLLFAGVAAIAIGFLVYRRYEKQIEARALAQFPGERG